MLKAQGCNHHDHRVLHIRIVEHDDDALPRCDYHEPNINSWTSISDDQNVIASTKNQ